MRELNKDNFYQGRVWTRAQIKAALDERSKQSRRITFLYKERELNERRLSDKERKIVELSNRVELAKLALEDK